MIYAYLQLARDDDAAREMSTRRCKVACRPSERFVAYYAIAAMAARYAVERGAWREAVPLTPAPSKYPFTEAMTHFARALGAARSGDLAAAQNDIARISGRCAISLRRRRTSIGGTKSR